MKASCSPSFTHLGTLAATHSSQSTVMSPLGTGTLDSLALRLRISFTFVAVSEDTREQKIPCSSLIPAIWGQPGPSKGFSLGFVYLKLKDARQVLAPNIVTSVFKMPPFPPNSGCVCGRCLAHKGTVLIRMCRRWGLVGDRSLEVTYKDIF